MKTEAMLHEIGARLGLAENAPLLYVGPRCQLELLLLAGAVSRETYPAVRADIADKPEGRG